MLISLGIKIQRISHHHRQKYNVDMVINGRTLSADLGGPEEIVLTGPDL